jgi:hypothetical protein
VNKTDYEILVNTMASREKPPEYAIKLLEDTCQRTGLDWKLRHLYLMSRGGKWMVTLSIDGFRLIGSQDSEYAGQEGPFWVTEASGTWSDIPPDGPVYAAKVGIKHRNGVVTWGVAKFKDYKAGPMWDKFPSTMSAKCAEMLAWRKAFPGRLGGLYGLEEMAQADKGAAEKVEQGAANGPLSEADLVVLRTRLQAALEQAQTATALKAVGKTIRDTEGLDEPSLAMLSELYQARKKILL